MPTATNLTGAEKAAILLLALGEDISGELFRHLSDAEAKRIAIAISRIGRVEQKVVDAVMVEFQAKLSQSEADLKKVVGGPESALSLMKRIKGFDADAFSKQLGLNTPPVYESLEMVDAKTLARILSKEQPQTIAAVLAHLDAKKFGETLKQLPSSMQPEIIVRVARLERIDPELMHEVDASIRAELEKTKLSGNGGKRLGGPAAVAAMLSSLDALGSGGEAGKAKALLQAIAEKHPDLASEIEELLFVFEDVAKLDDASLQKLLAQVPVKTLTHALKAASSGLQQRVFANMSPRAGERLRDDMDSLQKLKRSEAEAAQQEIARLARTLLDKGEIALPGSATEYV